MHFEAAVPSLTEAEQMAALVSQMASLTAMFETILKTAQDKTLEKNRRDLLNQVKPDVILSTADLETRVETIDAKVLTEEVESDMQHHDLDIDDLEAFKEDIVPKIDLELARPASSNISPDDRNDFPRFSGYIGTGTTLQKPVPPDECYKFVLPVGASDTDSYVDHNILLTNQVQSDLKTFTDEIDNRIDGSDSTLQLLTDNGIDEVYTHVTSDFTGDIPVSPSKLEPVVALVQSDLKTSTDAIDNRIDGSDSNLQLSMDNCVDEVYTQVTSDFTGDIPVSPSKLEPVVALPTTPPSPLTENMDFPRFSCYMGTPTNLQPTVSPADCSKFLLHARTSDTDSYVNHNIICISDDDDSTGLPPEEQGLFPFANHAISDVGSFMKNLKDLPACGDDPPLQDQFLIFLAVFGSPTRISSLFWFAISLMTRLDFRLNKVYFHSSIILNF
jgi:hypothetical protein